ncbi:MAG: hypothetical protein K0Q99_1772 [Clostridia bacterium]|nr:hypothetical protein [Clostridia bacterium]
MIDILFKDYTETKTVYHVVTITDLDDTLKYGIKFNDKNTYKSKYHEFHRFLDEKRPLHIPDWVIRSKAIFASMNFKSEHKWHSHSALLSIQIKEELCWICNENIANFLYEPLMLGQVPGFQSAKEFISRNGSKIGEDYWNCSLSFQDNLEKRNDKKIGYDAEVLILHDILPRDIELLYIISDHRCMEVNKWKDFFHSNHLDYAKC